MSAETDRLREAATARVTSGTGVASVEDRRAAFANELPASHPAAALVAKVANNAWKVTDEDVAAVTAAGVAEDAIFELVVCAAMGQAKRQLTAALAVVAEASRT
jgi:hypothetical protein